VNGPNQLKHQNVWRFFSIRNVVEYIATTIRSVFIVYRVRLKSVFFVYYVVMSVYYYHFFGEIKMYIKVPRRKPQKRLNISTI